MWTVRVNGRAPIVDSFTGLTVFDAVATMGDISNGAGADLGLVVDQGELRAQDWRDVYVVLTYQIAA